MPAALIAASSLVQIPDRQPFGATEKRGPVRTPDEPQEAPFNIRGTGLRERSAARVTGMAIAWLTFISIIQTAHAQHASDNPVASAEDAFGLTLGLETIGLYGPTGVRGFSPQAAGDVRIAGLYFDQQGTLSDRVVEGSTIHVGVSEIGYAFPAPTGIVDYDLRHPGNGTPSATIVASVGAIDARGLSIDADLPLISSELQLPMGASYQIGTTMPGATDSWYTSRVSGCGATPIWTPNDRVTLRAIFDWQQTTHATTLPAIFPAGNFVPPLIHGYQGQNWAEGRSLSENYGGIVMARLSPRWSLAAGMFRSISDSPISYSDLYVNTQPNGVAEHLVVGYPEQSVASTSGEARLTGRLSGATHRDLRIPGPLLLVRRISAPSSPRPVRGRSIPEFATC